MKHTLLLAILVACGGNGLPAPAQDDPVPPQKADVVLLVRNSAGELIDGAIVEPGGAVSDSEGRAAVRLDAQVERVLRIAKPGYATQVVRVSAADSVVVPTALIERADPVMITDASAGGTAAGADGARVTLPANALVDGVGQLVSGAVDVFLTPVDITDDRGKDAFPGRYEEEGGDGLLSYGCVDITFEQNGEELDLAPGVTATIEVPIYVTAQPDGTPIESGDEIPLWSLDETTGIWRNEGTGTVVASVASPAGWALRGTASHFSWWNCDLDWPLRKRKLKINTSIPGDDVYVLVKTESAAGLGPRGYASRTVEAGVETEITLPVDLAVELEATAFDGWLRGKLSIAADNLDERLELTLEPSSEVRPGERIRGSMTEVDELHIYGFEAFADEVFSLTVYPVTDHQSGPGVSGNLAGTVLIKGIAGIELTRASFDADGAAEIVLPLPDSGRYTVEIIADGKVPGWYLGTTAIAAPKQLFDVELAYTIEDGDLYHVNIDGALPGNPVQLNPDRGGRIISDFRLVPDLGVLYTFNGRTTPPDLFLADPARPGEATMLNRASEVPFGSFGVEQFEASGRDPTKVVYTVYYGDLTGALFLVDTDEPGLSKMISDPTLVAFHGRVHFQFVRGGGSVVYSVVTDPNVFPNARESFIVDIDKTDTPVPLNAPLPGGVVLHALGAGGASPEGREFLYVAGDPGNSADLYLVDVFDPGKATRINDPATNVRVSASTWFSNSRFVFFLSNDGTNSVNELFFVQTRNPGDVQTINAPSTRSINGYAVGSTGRVAYKTDNKLHLASLLDPGVSTPVDGVGSPYDFTFSGDGAHVVVRYQEAGTDTPRLALVEVDAPTNVVQLLPPIPANSAGVASDDINLTPSGDGVVVYGDLDGSGTYGLFLISFARPGIAVKANGEHGEIEKFEVR